MTEYSERFDALRRGKVQKYRPAVLFLVPLAAILFQFYARRLFPFFENLSLPLLVTVYFSLMRRVPVVGILIGCAIGLFEDAIDGQPLGVYGITLTLVGYFSASMSLKIDAENPAVRLFLSFFFFFFHQLFYWVLVQALLGLDHPFHWANQLVLGVLNAALGLPLFAWFDRLREK